MVYPDTDDIQTTANNVISHFDVPVIAPGKKIMLTLIWGDFAQAYQIKSITNTTSLKPKTWLNDTVVSKLCATAGWEINIIEDELLQNIIGMVSKIPIPIV